MRATSPVGRRAVLRTLGTGVAVAGVAGRGAGQASGDRFATWFADVDNYDGVVDRRGSETVTVAVGAAGNGGAFAFEPAAVRVDPGTTVIWEWTGAGGLHDVSAEDGSYGSQLTDEAGVTFEHTFDAGGVSYYACSPHKPMGMKGAVVVGDVPVGGGGGTAPEPDYGGWFDGVPNFEGTVDATGTDEVRVQVGTTDGRAIFEPAAVRVDPGTTVSWEWAGGGAAHDVAAADGSYASDRTAEAGHVYALTFDGTGISKYACSVHESMRGAVVVGEAGQPVTALSPLGMLGVGGAALTGLAALAAGVYLHAAESTRERLPPAGGRPGHGG